MRLLRRHRPHRQAHVEGPPAADERRQERRADDEPEARADERELGARAGDAQVGSGGEERAASDRRRVERGDHDRRHRDDPLARGVDQIADVAPLGLRQRDVRAGAERRRVGGCKDDGRLLDRSEGLDQLVDEPPVDRVAPLPTVEREEHDFLGRPVDDDARAHSSR